MNLFMIIYFAGMTVSFFTMMIYEDDNEIKLLFLIAGVLTMILGYFGSGKSYDKEQKK
jgi:ABC-type antimicrobial peptide transport system permease subunit